MEWNGVEQHLTVYFTEEISNGSVTEGLDAVILHHQLDQDKVLMIGDDQMDQNFALSSKIKVLSIGKLLVP